jgi:uncharacterized membrane protein
MNLTPRELAARTGGLGDVRPPSEGAGVIAERQHHLHRRADRVARGLGWLSLALGIAQLAAPGTIARLAGVRDDRRSRRAARAVGLREIIAGLGILTRERPAGFLAARVAGDAIDLALLGSVGGLRRRDRGRVRAAQGAAAALAALDAACALALGWRLTPRASRPHELRKIEVVRSICVERPVDDVYGFFRNLPNLPRFMRHLTSVEEISPRRSRWKAIAPAGRVVEWEAELISERPSELLAWRTVPGAEIENGGSVRFRPVLKGTEVMVTMRYEPPAGLLGATVAKLFGEEPGQQVEEDLRRLKEVLEGPRAVAAYPAR